MDAEKFAQALRLFAAGLNRMADSYHSLQVPDPGADQEGHTTLSKTSSRPSLMGLKVNSTTQFAASPTSPVAAPTETYQGQMAKFLTGKASTPPPPLPSAVVGPQDSPVSPVPPPPLPPGVEMAPPVSEVVKPILVTPMATSSGLLSSNLSPDEIRAVLATVDLDNGTASRGELVEVATKLGIPYTAKRASELRVMLMEYRDKAKNYVLPFPQSAPVVASIPSPPVEEDDGYEQMKRDVDLFIQLNKTFLESQGFFSETPSEDPENPTYTELMASRSLVEAAYEDNVAPLIASGEWAAFVKKAQKGA